MAKKNGSNGNGNGNGLGLREAPILRPEELEGLPVATRYLRHVLTDVERHERRCEREQIDARGDTIEAELEGLKKQVKQREKALDVEREQSLAISRVLRAGVEYRDVDCAEVRVPSDIIVDWELPDDREHPTGALREIAITVRIDTRRAVDWRELRADERQGTLFDDAPAEEARA